MLKLYGGRRSRATIVRWYLEELAIPYEFTELDMQVGEHLKPDFLAVNPMGKVPAIEDGSFKLWESGAILLYLSEKYDTPAVSMEERAIYAQWILFANATLGPGIFMETTREKEKARLFPALDTLLSRHPFLSGDRLTVADIAVGSMLGYINFMLPVNFDEFAAIANYLKHISARPAFQKTIGATMGHTP
jgi:glutathione S-transferase